MHTFNFKFGFNDRGDTSCLVNCFRPCSEATKTETTTLCHPTVLNSFSQ